jgi:hypothetical protein
MNEEALAHGGAVAPKEEEKRTAISVKSLGIPRNFIDHGHECQALAYYWTPI